MCFEYFQLLDNEPFDNSISKKYFQKYTNNNAGNQIN